MTFGQLEPRLKTMSVPVPVFALAIAARNEPKPESAVVVTDWIGELLMVDSNAPRSGALPICRDLPDKSVAGKPPLTLAVPVLMTFDTGDSMGRKFVSSFGSAVVFPLDIGASAYAC